MGLPLVLQIDNTTERQPMRVRSGRQPTAAGLARAATVGIGLWTGASLAVIAGLAAVSPASGPDAGPFGADFVNFWAAGRMVWAGLGDLVYQPQMHKLAEVVARPVPLPLDFVYPPPFILVCAPFGALPFGAALLAFLACGFAGLILALRGTTRQTWALLATISAPAVLIDAIIGQSAILVAALLGGGLVMLDRAPRRAGLVLGLLVIKPTLALALPVMLVLTRRWLALTHAALSCALACALATLVFGPGIWPAFLAAAPAVAAWLRTGDLEFSKIQSLYGLMRQIGFGVGTGYAMQAASALFALAMLAIVLRRRHPPEVVNATTVIAGLLIPPYFLAYDLAVTVLPLLWLNSAWQRDGFPRWGKPMLAVSWAMPLSFLLDARPHLPVLWLFGLLAYLACIRPPGGVEDAMWGRHAWPDATMKDPGNEPGIPCARC